MAGESSTGVPAQAAATASVLAEGAATDVVDQAEATTTIRPPLNKRGLPWKKKGRPFGSQLKGQRRRPFDTTPRPKGRPKGKAKGTPKPTGRPKGKAKGTPKPRGRPKGKAKGTPKPRGRPKGKAKGKQPAAKAKAAARLEQSVANERIKKLRREFALLPAHWRSCPDSAAYLLNLAPDEELGRGAFGRAIRNRHAAEDQDALLQIVTRRFDVAEGEWQPSERALALAAEYRRELRCFCAALEEEPAKLRYAEFELKKVYRPLICAELNKDEALRQKHLDRFGHSIYDFPECDSSFDDGSVSAKGSSQEDSEEESLAKGSSQEDSEEESLVGMESDDTSSEQMEVPPGPGSSTRGSLGRNVDEESHDTSEELLVEPESPLDLASREQTEGPPGLGSSTRGSLGRNVDEESHDTSEELLVEPESPLDSASREQTEGPPGPGSSTRGSLGRNVDEESHDTSEELLVEPESPLDSASREQMEVPPGPGSSTRGSLGRSVDEESHDTLVELGIIGDSMSPLDSEEDSVEQKGET